MTTHHDVSLTVTQEADLSAFFRFQLDEEANYLAAFTPEDPTNEAAYLAKFSRLLKDPTITMRTIWVDGEIVGSVAKYLTEGEPQITYWLDRRWWGRGVATTALRAFLQIEHGRPIYGRAAFDNYGSQKVMEKCGFVRIGTDRGYANARGAEIEEFIYRLAL